MTSGCRVPSCGRAFFFRFGRFGLTRIRWIRQPVGYPTLATPNGTDNPPIKSSRAGVPTSSAASSRYAHIANGMGDQTGSASSILAAAEEHDGFSSTAPRGIGADAWKLSAEGSEARVEFTVARRRVGSFPRRLADTSDARTSVGGGSRGGSGGRCSAAADLSCSISSTTRLSTSSVSSKEPVPVGSRLVGPVEPVGTDAS